MTFQFSYSILVIALIINILRKVVNVIEVSVETIDQRTGEVSGEESFYFVNESFVKQWLRRNYKANCEYRITNHYGFDITKKFINTRGYRVVERSDGRTKSIPYPLVD